MKVIRIIFLSALLMGFTGVVQAQTWWGAFYIDTNTGIVGGNYNSSSEALAKRGANQSCNDKHKGKANKCQHAGSFYNACGAVYWSPVNKKWGWGWNSINSNRAETNASSACAQAGGKNCERRLSICTNRVFY